MFVKQVEEGIYSINLVGDNPHFVFNFKAEGSQYQGLRLRMLLPCALPPWCRGQGLCFCKSGEPMELLPFALSEGVCLTVDELRKLCREVGVRPCKNAQGNMNKPQYLAALVEHAFPGDVAEQARVNNLHMMGESDITYDKTLVETLDGLDVQNGMEFQNLRAKLKTQEIKQTLVRAERTERRPETQARAEAGYKTPAHLRELIPGQGTYPLVALYENPIRQNYVAHHPYGIPFTSCRLAPFHLTTKTQWPQHRVS